MQSRRLTPNPLRTHTAQHCMLEFAVELAMLAVATLKH